MAGTLGALPELPSGEVCFLFTDVESSTSILRAVGDQAWSDMQQQMYDIVRNAVETRGGSFLATEGDGCFAAFPSASQGVQACADAQHALGLFDWGARPVRVRMGLHLGQDVHPRDGDYVALAVHQAARVTAAANGGQVLATPAVVERAAEAGVFVDLGLFSVRDFDGPVRLYALRLRDGDRPSGSPRVPPAFDTQVPSYRSALVGRDTEIADVVGLLDAGPLVTLTGTAGIGKTRVAVAVLSQLSPELSVGPWFVDLTAAKEPADVGDVLALATGCPPDTAVDVHLDAVLDDRRGVLVLDNCEHLVAAAAAAAELLLAWCPTLRILATSVEPLGVADEVLYPVEPLGLPDSADPAAILGSNAGRLFVERATRVRPDLEVDSAAASSVYEICQGVGGLPLALELAGGRCLQRSLDEIARSASRPLRDQVDAALDAVSATDGRSVAALSIVEPPIDDRLAAAALSAVGVNAADGQTVVQRLADRSLVQMQSGGIRLHEGVRVVAQARLSSVDRRAIAEHLLAESLQATSDPIAVSAHEVFVRTASRLIEDESLPIGARQRLAAQLGPWWTARLGGKRARDRLMEMLSLSAEGPAATAVHLAIADSYGAGRETLETERHLREAARMLGRHDVVDPAVVDRLKSLTAKLRSGEDAES